MVGTDLLNGSRARQGAVVLGVCGLLLVTAVGIVTADPTARCTLSRTEIHPGESVELDASDSENATAYRFNDSGSGDWTAWQDSPTKTFTYEETGTYHPRVQVRSAADFTDTAACGTLHVVANEPPTAAFDYSPTNPSPGTTVSFTATVDDSDGEVVEIMWEIDGETVADGTSFEHTFQTPGEYRVTLSVTDDDGATTTTSQTVVVDENQPPSVSFTYEPTAPQSGERVTFTASASDDDGSIASYRWQIDGETLGAGPRFAHTFETSGSYTVTLVVTDDDGATARAEQVITVGEPNTPPTVEFTWTPADPTVGESVTFEAAATDEDGSITAYRWQIDGDPVGDGPQLTYTFEDPGTHVVVLHVTDDDGATTTLNRTVTIDRPPTTTTTTANVDVTADWWHTPRYPAAGEQVSLIATGPPDAGVTYRWDVDNDGTYELEGITVVHTFTEPGTYEVTLEAVGPGGETHRYTRTVTVHNATDTGTPGDGPLFWVTPTQPRPGEPVTFVVDLPPGVTHAEGVRWDFDGDGTVDKRGRSVTYAFPENGTVDVTVWVELPNGTVQQSDSSVTTAGDRVEGPTEDEFSLWSIPFNPDRNETVTLLADPPSNDSAVTAYRWDLDGDGEYEKTGAAVTYSFSTADRMPVRLQIKWANGSTTVLEDTIPVGNATIQAPRSSGPSIPVGPAIALAALAMIVAGGTYYWRYHRD